MAGVLEEQRETAPFEFHYPATKLLYAHSKRLNIQRDQAEEISGFRHFSYGAWEKKTFSISSSVS